MQYAMDAHNNSSSMNNQQLQQLQQQQHLLQSHQGNFDDDNSNMLALANQEAKSAEGGLGGGASGISAQYMQELTLARTIGAQGTSKNLGGGEDSNNPKKRMNEESMLHQGGPKRANAGTDLRHSVSLQQQFLSQQQQQQGNSNQGSLPRPPNSPGSWNAMGAGAMNLGLGGEDFAGANAALRRNLASLQQQQAQQQQSFSGQPMPNHQGSGGFGNPNGQQGGGMGMNAMGMNAAAMGAMGGMFNPNGMGDPLAAPNANQMWATEMLLRSQGGPGGPSNPMGNAGNPGAGGADSLMQLQLLRQQQARIQQLEQLEEEAVMRRQLQLLRQQQSNNGQHPNAMNPMNMNSGPGTGLDTLRLQQQLQQQQQQNAQGMFGQEMQQQQLQQQQWMSSPHQGGKPMIGQGQGGNFGGHVGSGMDVMGGGSSIMDRRNSGGQNNNSSRSGSTRALQSRRSSTASASSSSIARATPMVGPVAPPVPAPPPSSQANYKLPPIEEGDTRHFDNRVHVPLAIEEDQNWLSEFQCFVRSDLLQVFRASHQDVKIRVASKKVYYKQVGIRCKFCAHWKPSTRAIRSSAFPSSIRQLYQSFTMMLRDHFGNCPAIPTHLKDRFLELKRNNTQGASDSMRYWIYSAVKLGMVDSDCGIVLNEQTQAAASTKPPFGTNNDNAVTANQDQPPRLLVKPEDLEQSTISSEFLYTLLTQYQLIRLLSTECIGNRKSLRPGVPGLGCRYCCAAGRMGLSRVFPAKKKQLPTQIQDLFDHMRRCNLCPAAVKEELQSMKEDRDTVKRGSAVAKTNPDGTKDKPMRIIDDDDKGFVDLLWQRLGHRGELATPIV